MQVPLSSCPQAKPPFKRPVGTGPLVPWLTRGNGVYLTQSREFPLGHRLYSISTLSLIALLVFYLNIFNSGNDRRNHIVWGVLVRWILISGSVVFAYVLRTMFTFTGQIAILPFL